MSVLVKGMQMPHDCFECPFSIPPINDDSPLWMCGGNGMSVHEADTEGHRPYGCPLEEVEDEQAESRYCDRNICASNEVNGISCDECEVAKYHNLEDDDSPCQNCGG